MEAERLIEIIEDAGYETQNYSGRAMYGDECPAFVTDNPIKAVAEIVGSVGDENEREEIVEAFSRAKEDSMGRDVVIYFPHVITKKYYKSEEAAFAQ